MSAFSSLMEIYNFLWMIESHGAQRLAWQDAADMRIARRRAEDAAAAKASAMLDANPSVQLGSARLDDPAALRKSGLL